MFSNIAQITFSFPSFPFFLSFGRFFLKNLQTHHTQKAMVRQTNTKEKIRNNTINIYVSVNKKRLYHCYHIFIIKYLIGNCNKLCIYYLNLKFWGPFVLQRLVDIVLVLVFVFWMQSFPLRNGILNHLSFILSFDRFCIERFPKSIFKLFSA